MSANLSQAPTPAQSSPSHPSPKFVAQAAPPNVRAAETASSNAPETPKKRHSKFASDALIFLKSRDVLRVAAFLIVVAGIGLGLRFSGFFSHQGSETDPMERFTNVAIPDSVSEEPVIAKSVGSQLLNGAFLVLNQFQAAETPEEKLKWVLQPDAVRAQLLRYYADNPNRPEEPIAGFASPQRIVVDDIRRGIVALVKQVPDESNREKQDLKMIAFFKQTSEGIRLDWESYIQAKDGTSRQFLSDDNSPPGVYRVRLTRAHYFGHGSQPANTVCLQLDDLVSLPKQPYLFVPEGTEIAEEIKDKLVWSENVLDSTRYATVRLAWKPSLKHPSARSLMIDELICWELLGVGSEAVAPAPRS
ncbi:MAG: hypothetical protein O3C21_06710 [Verrucomicrobia bacterium]|nr:hypothetical protein [Verrucomicrobiota bacterium]